MNRLLEWNRRISMAAASAVIGFAIAGCGGGPVGPEGAQAEVTGSVLIDGKPLPPNSQVVFANIDQGVTLVSGTDSLGKFVLTPGDPRIGVPVGRYRVSIQPPTAAVVDANQGAPDYTKMMQSGVQDAKPAKDDSPIPEKFRDANTSGLVFEVKEGPNNFDLDLAKL